VPPIRSPAASDRRLALGCCFARRAVLGARLSTQWSLTATAQHLSNTGSCGEHGGLKKAGARVGHAF
jgi:hypothetical protein